MINEKEATRISKLMSPVLRHKPETVNITLDEQGCTDVDILIERLNVQRLKVTKAILEHVVSTNNKSRFAFNADCTRIRASQGHSVNIKLGYEPKQPPAVLFHGTAESSLPSIFKQAWKNEVASMYI